MSRFCLQRCRIPLLLWPLVLLLSSCSGSGGSGETPSSANTGVASSDAVEMSADDGGLPDDATAPTPILQDSSVPDPMVQNTTRVTFDIEVPAYQSTTLQVRLAWGEKALNAAWVGDEFWSITEEFPTNTENLLTATFFDRNGDITLASFEDSFRTGTNASETYSITSDQFDTNRWDDDGDGIDNLDELISGTYTASPSRILLFSETRAFRHDSIATALEVLQQLASSAGIEVDQAGDSAGVFTDENLSSYDAVVWVLTSGDVLDDNEQTSFENYIRAGGGFAGIHAASDTEYDWPWYGNLVGAYFERHPVIQSATQVVEDRTHISTAHLESTWTRTDEWYDYRSNPRAQVNVLLTLDESSYTDGGMGEDHPSAWYHAYDGGRSWYTGGGHTLESYAEPAFQAHLLGGLRYAAGLE